MDINRKTSYLTLFEIEKNGAYSNIELNNQINKNEPNSPAFVRELVYGVLENKIYLDYILDILIPSGLRQVKTSDITILRMGIYQIAFMNSVPEYAAVNESVSMAKKFCKGRDSFINGVLRGYIKKKDTIKLPKKDEDLVGYLSIKYSFLPWIVELWISQYGAEDAEKILCASNEKPNLTIRINQLKTDRSTLKKILIELGFSAIESTLSDKVLIVSGSGILETQVYKDGLFSVQDEASVIAIETLGPKENEIVADVCAAPGGKSLAIAELMGNKGKIYSMDIYDHKLSLIEGEAKRLGISIINVLNHDGQIPEESLINKCNKVLVDGPCSGLGVIRKKPEIKYKTITDDGVALGEKQLQILSVASKYLLDGGTLLYSTCTINKIENESVIEHFLNINKNFDLVEKKQFLPNIDGTDGFFICKMKKTHNLKGEK